MARRSQVGWVVALLFTGLNLALVGLAAAHGHGHRHWHQLAVHGGLLLVGVCWVGWLASRRVNSRVDR
jgi:hypothetical protein